MKLATIAIAGVATLACAVAQAELAVGAPAPDFSAEAALAGKQFHFALADALKKGPVVVYFYPKSFTKGCTIEAHNFAEATPEFAKQGATVIGISSDDINTQKEFSTKECRDKFAVAADPDGAIMRKYDAKMPLLEYASRVSYVISPDGKVLSTYSSMSPDQHVENSMKAVVEWREKNAKH